MAHPSDSAPESGLRMFGGFLVMAGALGMLISFLLPTAVDVEPVYVLGREIGGGAVDNVGLLARNLSILIASGLTMVTGAVLLVAGHVSDLREGQRIRR